jgi:hypothetical protein
LESPEPLWCSSSVVMVWKLLTFILGSSWFCFVLWTLIWEFLNFSCFGRVIHLVIVS